MGWVWKWVRTALAAAVLLGARGAVAQTVLVSNLGKLVWNYESATTTTYWAVAFITPATGAMQLHSVDLDLPYNPQFASVRLHAKLDGSTNVGAELCAFNAGALQSGNVYRFPAAATVTLQPSTRYWVVLRSTDPNTDPNTAGTDWNSTDSPNFTGTGSIPATDTTAKSLDSGATWTRFNGFPFIFAVQYTTPAAITSFNATPATVFLGGGSLLSWVATGSLTLNGNPVTGTSLWVTPITTTVYTLADALGASRLATVTVRPFVIRDLAALSRAWGYAKGHASYDPACDANGDGLVNDLDADILLR